MIKKVKDFIQKEMMIKKNREIVVGISGGADSVCLLFVLLELSQMFEYKLIPVHINHNLRGEEAKRDQEFVEHLCKRLELDLIIRQVDVSEYAQEQKLSIEEAGRVLRRHELEAVASLYQDSLIALGHHANDNVETSLMNQVRGTGIVGLAGILPVQGIYIRPLLCVKRKEIEEYMEQVNEKYCVDSTNLENIYTRNGLRNQVIPSLEELVNANAVDNMSAMLEDMRDILDYLKDQVDEVASQVVDNTENSYLIKKQEYEQCHGLIKRELVKKVIVMQAKCSKDIGRAHILAVDKLFSLQVGKEVHLPYGIIAKRVHKGVEIRNNKDWGAETTFACIELRIPGKTLVSDNLVVETSILDVNSLENINDTHYTKYMDYDIIKDKLLLDRVNMSDYITINEQGGRQSIKKYCTNQKIDLHLRKEMLNIRDESNVYWILGYRRSFEARVTKQTKKILKIQIGGDEYGRKN